MKLVKIGSVIALLFLVIATLVIMFVLDDITYAISDRSRGFWDSIPRWEHSRGWVDDGLDRFGIKGDQPNWVWGDYISSPWITGDGNPTNLTYILTFVICLIVGSILFFPPYIRAKNIQLGFTNNKTLIYIWGVLYIFIGVIPAIFLFIGAMNNKGDIYNSEISYSEDRRIYEGSRRGRDKIYDRNIPQNHLIERLKYLENELNVLEKRSRNSRYDIDDEFDYTHRRNNRKFRDIEDEIDELHDRLDRKRRRY